MKSFKELMRPLMVYGTRVVTKMRAAGYPPETILPLDIIINCWLLNMPVKDCVEHLAIHFAHQPLSAGLDTYWRKTGEYFGFPTCCIDNFLKRCESMDKGNVDIATDNQKRVTNNTGFVPCPKHADQIIAGTITLESLITNRQHSSPFPNVNDEEFERFQQLLDETTQ